MSYSILGASMASAYDNSFLSFVMGIYADTIFFILYWKFYRYCVIMYKIYAEGGQTYMNWFSIFLLGLLSGLTQFIPISASGHQRLMLHLLGETQIDPLCRFILSCGTLIALLTACTGQIRRLIVERNVEKRGSKFRAYGGRRYDYRLVKTVALPIAIVHAVGAISGLSVGLPVLTISFLLNGVILFVIGNMRQGNKDSRRMTKLDSFYIGMFGCLSVIPGISLVGTVTSAGISRGAQRQTALNWSFIVCIAVLLVRMVVDLILTVTYGTMLTFVSFLFCLVGALFAFIGGRFSIQFARFAVNRSGLAGFSYYVWGAALLTFILFLIS